MRHQYLVESVKLSSHLGQRRDRARQRANDRDGGARRRATDGSRSLRARPGPRDHLQHETQLEYTVTSSSPSVRTVKGVDIELTSVVSDVGDGDDVRSTFLPFPPLHCFLLFFFPSGSSSCLTSAFVITLSSLCSLNRLKLTVVPPNNSFTASVILISPFSIISRYMGATLMVSTSKILVVVGEVERRNKSSKAALRDEWRPPRSMRPVLMAEEVW